MTATAGLDAAMPGGTGAAVEIGAENEARMRRRLWADAGAIEALRGQTLADATIRRFRLGLNEPTPTRNGLLTARALAMPLLLPDGSRSGRWGFMSIEGVTVDAPHPVAWTAGGPRVFWSGPRMTQATLLVVASPFDVMLLWQAIGQERRDLVIVSSSIPYAVPAEWRDPAFWRGWSEVVLGLRSTADEEEVARVIGRSSDRELLACVPAEAWSDMVRTGASLSEIRGLLGTAAPWRPPSPAVQPHGEALVGDFGAAPVAIEGGLVGGLLHYPVTMERRSIERRGAADVVVQRYVTRILRSDGALLDVERLPAPIGTPAGGRVLALSDGTRILSEPRPGRFGTWSHASIESFRASRGRGEVPSRRTLPRLLADVEAHLRSSVWLPDDDGFALASLFAAATFVHRAFEAFPILLVNGPRGSGKSELGNAMAAICANAVVAGRVTPAGLVRLLAESRGTVVLDDLEAIANPRNAADDVPQILKVSYKASTATRVMPGRDGRVEVLDFFAPKIVTNIGSADAVLLSRMLTVRTSPLPVAVDLAASGPHAPDLRDELHVWAMCEIAEVRTAYAAIGGDVRSRRDEIAAPLRAVAALAGGDWERRLEKALSADPPAAPERVDAVLARALRSLATGRGLTAVAMPQLALEMASTARGPVELPAAETLGRMLIALGARDREGAVDRRRLHGEVTRVYSLLPAYLERLGRPSGPTPDPFAFCAGPCASCAYDAVCDDAAPWLRPARLRRAKLADSAD